MERCEIKQLEDRNQDVTDELEARKFKEQATRIEKKRLTLFSKQVTLLFCFGSKLEARCHNEHYN